MRIVLETPAQSSRILLLSSWVAITTAIAPPSIWTVDIDNSPAPSPEDGPPASFHASRNPALLPAQIGAIVSAYVLSVLIIGSAILWIGRRLRRETNVPAKPLDVEMVTTLAKGFNFDPSPISPRSQPHPHSRNFSWPSPTEKDRNPYIFPPSTRAPPAESHPSIDTRVVTADQEMAQQDLEAIYAHVMEQEAAKAQGIILKEIPLPLRAQNGPAPLPSESPQRQNTPPKKAERSKTKPLSIETDETKVVGRRQSFASSLISSIKSPRSPRKKGLKGLVISSPVSSTGSVPWSGNASDEEPLSPRYYSPPPPPPVPQDQAPPHSPLQQTHTRNDSSTSIPLSIAERISTPRSQHPPVSFRDPQQPQPQPQPQSPQSASAESLPHALPLSSHRPPKQSLKTGPFPYTTSNPSSKATTPVPSSTTSSRVLPFRQLEQPGGSASFSPSTKTTILERTSTSNGPRTGRLNTPFSAGAVPYSPYMPNTPIFPISPRLVTKEERKMRKKFEGRKPVLELIKSDDEIWDSSY